MINILKSVGSIIVIILSTNIGYSQQAIRKIQVEGNLKKLQGAWQLWDVTFSKGSRIPEGRSPSNYYYIIKNDTCFETPVIQGDTTIIFLARGNFSIDSSLKMSDIDNINGTEWIDTIGYASLGYNHSRTIEFGGKDTLWVSGRKWPAMFIKVRDVSYLTLKFINIISNKAIIYSLPGMPTQMYLQKGDEIEVLEEKDDWLRIRYYGKKIIEGWIKKEDVN